MVEEVADSLCAVCPFSLGVSTLGNFISLASAQLGQMLVELKDRAFEERDLPIWAHVDLSWELQPARSSPWDT